MRILVTGAAGFLGSHLVTHLLARGHEVLAVDNFFTGSRRNLASFRQHPQFEFLRHDITFPLYVEVDAIFNLACPASPIWYQRDPVQTMKTSVLGAINMLGMAKRLGIRIIQASTSEIYGDPKVSPQPETYWGHVNPVGVRSCYDEGKRAAETLFADYRRQHGIDARIIRIFNTYGPGMSANDGRVVSNFITQALRGMPITIYGDGSQTRSFCYVTDLIRGIVDIASLEEPPIGPLNLGTDEEVSVHDLAQEVIHLTASDSEIQMLPLPKDDPASRRPDLTSVKDLIDWRPRVSRMEGLKRTIDYFNGEIDSNSSTI